MNLPTALTRILMLLAAVILAARFAAAQTAAPTPSGEVTMTLISEAGEHYLLMQDFLRVVQHFDPQARGGYDSRSQSVRINAGGKQFDILGRQPAIVIDGRMSGVDRQLTLREGRVLVPEATVRKVLTALNIEVSGEGQKAPASVPAAPAPVAATPTPTPAPAVPALPDIPTGVLNRPTPTPSPTPTAAPTAAPAIAEPTPEPTVAPAPPDEARRTVIVPSRPEPRQKKSPSNGDEAVLQPPQALAGTVGLSWAQLSDLAHRQPPSRITIVCDRALEPIAQKIGQELEERIQLESSVLIAPNGQRAQDSLVTQVYGQSPQLVIDVMATRPASQKADDPKSYAIWVVNSALWPERQSGEPVAQRFAQHEFQSLALGSLLRTELGRQFPDQTIAYELAPSYLLRRVDAPSAAVVVPMGARQETPDPEDAGRVASAVASAVIAYVHGMSRVGF
ncbi:MAG: hypothetical protein ABFD69_17280 [Candidatus Sumerlaeia bacterium]